MDRRQFVRASAAALTVGATGGIKADAASLRRPGRAAMARADAPNFLFFIADDCMFRTINAINNKEVFTPNLDRLVREGKHFTHCFHAGSWTGAVCVASRTMLLTGLTPFKAQHALPSDGGAQIPTWGETFRRAGYRSFMTGKWHLDAVSLSRSFAQTSAVAPGFLNSTPDMYDRPKPGNHWTPTDRTLKGHWLDRSEWVDPAKTGTAHSSEVYADAVIAFLTEQRGSRQPFFAYVGFNAPHDPRQAPEEFQARYSVDRIQIPPNYLPQHPFNQGDYYERDEKLAPFPRTQRDVQTHRKEYYALITHMDAQIGRVLDALEAAGKADNTYVIFTADHGLAVGEHGLMGKQNQYECSMRMPLLMRGPGIKPGSVCRNMVYQHSMYATTCDLASIAVPAHVEFPSLKSMAIHDQAEPVHDAMFGWLSNLQRSIRTERYKLIFYAGIRRYQLFDLENDPWEMHDLIHDAGHAEIKADLVRRLKQQQQTWGDSLSLDDPPKVSPRDSQMLPPQPA